MSKKTDNALRLVIVDERVEDAEALVSGLRNAGIAVRPVRATTREELSGALSGHADLVLAALTVQALPFEDTMQLVTGTGKDLPVVAIADRLDETEYDTLLNAGARGVALRHRPQQVLSQVRNEWADLEARRAQRRLEARVRETERRCDALIESSRDPIAYIHEGMHIRANSAYLEMFGYDSFEDIEGMSLLDMVGPQHVDDFKQLLKSLAEGEPCLQVVFRRQEFDPELAHELEELRQRDQVTGLLNRPTFLLSLEDAVGDAGQNNGQHGLLMIE